MCKTIRNCVLIFTMLLSVNLFAQKDSVTVQKFSLTQAQEFAIKNNYNVKNAVHDLKSAEKKIWETTAIGLPQINGNIKYQHMYDIPVTLIPDFISPAMLSYFQANPKIFNNPDVLNQDAIGKALKTASENPQTFPAKFGTSDNMSWGITVTQLIFSGEYIVGLEASRIFKEFSTQSLTKTEKDTRESVSKSYYLVLVAEENLKIIDSTLQNTEKIYKEIEAMLKVGFIENTDLDQMKLTVESLKNTRSAIAKQTEVAYRLLKFQLGINLDQKIELTDKFEDIITQANIQAFNVQNFDLTKYIDYKIMQTNERLQVLNLKREQSTLLPTIAGFYSYSKSAMRNTFDFFTTGPWFPTSVIGVQIDIPIFTSGKRYFKIAQAKIAVDKAKTQKEMAAQGILLDYEQSKIAFIVALDKYTTQKSNLELSKKIYDKTFKKYKQGVATSMDLTQTQNQYLATQSNYFSAIIELLNTKAKLDKLFSN